MNEIQINWLGLITAAMASMVVGYLWYGPLFGSTWMKLTGRKKVGNKSQMPKTYTIMFVASMITAYALTVIGTGLEAVFWVWFGFQATFLLQSVLFEGRSWNLYFLTLGHQLASLIVMSWVLSIFK